MSSQPRRVTMVHRPISEIPIIQKIANAIVSVVDEHRPATHWAVVVSLNDKYINKFLLTRQRWERATKLAGLSSSKTAVTICGRKDLHGRTQRVSGSIPRTWEDTHGCQTMISGL